VVFVFDVHGSMEPTYEVSVIDRTTDWGKKVRRLVIE
jgi:hypothetical protein